LEPPLAAVSTRSVVFPLDAVWAWAWADAELLLLEALAWADAELLLLEALASASQDERSASEPLLR
jgi:hypothetical protein